MNERKNLGFIGLGLMGNPMAQRLVKAGYRVTVWNRNPLKVEPLISCGAQAAVTAAELVGRSDIVMLCVSATSAVDSLRPVLSVLSQRVTHMGPVGSGQLTKICNQILVMAEVMALAETAGVDSRKIPAALKGGFADSIPLQLTGTRMANRDFDAVKWHVKTLLKDLNMGCELSRFLDGNNPMVQLAVELMQGHAEAGYAERDPSTLIEAYLK